MVKHYFPPVILAVLILSSSCVINISPASTANTIKIVAPNGSEKWQAGDSENISYAVTGGAIANVLIEYSADGGKAWSLIASVPATGTYTWTVPDIRSANCLVRTTIFNSGNSVLAQDISDRIFSIGVQQEPPAAVKFSIKTGALGVVSNTDRQKAFDSVASQLKAYISNALPDMQQALPRNPHLTAQINAKIALLQDPNLYNKVVQGNLFAVDSVVSTAGGKILIVAAFPAENMRNEAVHAMQVVKMSLPLMEEFFAVPYPRDIFTIWYGFSIKDSGGLGVMTEEEQSSYEARWKPPFQPYDAILCHEFSHSYILHEGLNQFLEVYQCNMIATHSAKYSDWTYLRNYETSQAAKTSVMFVMDVYQLLGLPAMKKAYRTLYQYKPPYGQHLSAQCKQVFVDCAPANLKTQVSSIVANITY